MIGLRVTARLIACIIGFGAIALTLANLPWDVLRSDKPAPSYFLSNLASSFIPLMLALGITLGLLLIARVDERLERLEKLKSS